MNAMNMDSAVDRHLDCLLELAFEAEAAGAERATWTEDEEALCQRAWAAFTEKWEARQEAERRQKRRRRLGRAVQVAACGVLALGVALPVTFAASASFRARVLRLVTEATPRYTALSLEPDEDAAFDVPEGWQGEWYLSRVPEGYVLETVYPVFNTVDYKNAGGDRLTFDELDENAWTNLDTENADVRHVSVGGRQVMVVEKQTVLTAVWSTEDRYFILSLIGADRAPDQDQLLDLVAGVRRIVR